MGIRFNVKCCCNSGNQPAWTVYHENVNKEQHVLVCNLFNDGTTSLPSGLCQKLRKNDWEAFSFGTYCTYYSGSGSSWVYKSCPPDSGILGGPISTITVTPFPLNLSGVYNGNTWIHPLRIESIRLQYGSLDVSYNYDPSLPFFSESDHFCGHSEYSGALADTFNGYQSVSVTPYIGYKYGTYSGHYLMFDNISGSSLCANYGYVSGTISGNIVPYDDNQFAGSNPHYANWYSSIKDTYVNSFYTGDPLDSCSELSGYTVRDAYDITYISRFLPLHLNDFSGYQYNNLSTCESGRCALRKNLQSPTHKIGSQSSYVVGCPSSLYPEVSKTLSNDRYHGICSGTKFDEYLPRINCSGIAFSGLSGDRYLITNIESGLYNYYTPFFDNATYMYNDSCSILYDGFSNAYPVLNNYAPIIVKYPALSYLRINHLKTTTYYDYPVIAGPCDLWLPDVVCVQDYYQLIDYRYTSKLLVASNTGVRHICDDFDIANFSPVPYNGSGSGFSSCFGTDTILCANEEDYVTYSVYNDIMVFLGPDTTSPYFVSYLTGTSDLCIP